MADNRDHQKFGRPEVSAKYCLLLWRIACICNVLHLVVMSNIFVDQITKLLSLSFLLKTGPACYDQQGAIACVPEDDI